MRSILTNCDFFETFDFFHIEKSKVFKRFYEDLYNNSGFLQEFFREPVLRVNNKIILF